MGLIMLNINFTGELPAVEVIISRLKTLTGEEISCEYEEYGEDRQNVAVSSKAVTGECIGGFRLRPRTTEAAHYQITSGILESNYLLDAMLMVLWELGGTHDRSALHNAAQQPWRLAKEWYQKNRKGRAMMWVSFMGERPMPGLELIISQLEKRTGEAMICDYLEDEEGLQGADVSSQAISGGFSLILPIFETPDYVICPKSPLNYYLADAAVIVLQELGGIYEDAAFLPAAAQQPWQLAKKWYQETSVEPR